MEPSPDYTTAGTALWLHPGVMDEQREALLKEVFSRITIGGKKLMRIEPKPAYEPLFATIVTQLLLPSRIRVENISYRVEKLIRTI
jgi:hypothetical protein